MKVLHTIELEPHHGGHDHPLPVRRAEDAAGGGAMERIGPAYGEALQAGLPSLTAQLDAALAGRDADRVPEPELPAPRSGGLLS